MGEVRPMSFNMSQSIVVCVQLLLPDRLPLQLYSGAWNPANSKPKNSAVDDESIILIRFIALNQDYQVLEHQEQKMH